jgi:hypothetical protein
VSELGFRTISRSISADALIIMTMICGLMMLVFACLFALLS